MLDQGARKQQLHLATLQPEILRLENYNHTQKTPKKDERKYSENYIICSTTGLPNNAMMSTHYQHFYYDPIIAVLIKVN